MGPVTPHVRLLAPPADTARGDWCLFMLQQKIDSLCKFADVHVNIEDSANFAVACTDLRALKSWWLSIGFHVGSALSELWSTHQEKIMDNVSQQAFQAEVHIQAENAILQSSRSPDLHVEMKLFCTDSSEKDICCKKLWLVPLSGGMMGPIGDSVFLHFTGMVVEEYVAPAVVVLHGDPADQVASEEKFLSCLKDRLGGCMMVHSLVVNDKEDSVAVFGRPDEIQGGLFKFINSVNATTLDNQSNFGIVVAQLSEVGQFILRELLEDGISRTHRLSVRKNRIVFILKLDLGTVPTPQTRSRAHVIIPAL